jgi:hypothetical protein
MNRLIVVENITSPMPWSYTPERPTIQAMPTLLRTPWYASPWTPSSVIQVLANRLPLVVLLLACNTLSLALADNLLAEPLRREAVLQRLEVAYNVSAALDDRILGGDGAIGRDAQLEGRE